MLSVVRDFCHAAWTNKKEDAAAGIVPALADSRAAMDLPDPVQLYLDFTWTLKICAFPEFHHDPE